jgi:hypothetical protein
VLSICSSERLVEPADTNVAQTLMQLKVCKVAKHAEVAQTCMHVLIKSTSIALWAPSGCRTGGGDFGIMNSARIGCMSANGGFPDASCSADTCLTTYCTIQLMLLQCVRSRHTDISRWAHSEAHAAAIHGHAHLNGCDAKRPYISRWAICAALVTGLNHLQACQQLAVCTRPQRRAVTESDGYSPQPALASGAIQYGVPTNVALWKPIVPDNAPATPKSDSLTAPSAASSTFAAFRSRCILACLMIAARRQGKPP